MPKLRINLASTKLAFFLIACLLALILLSAIIPQQDIASGQILDWRETLGGGYELIGKLGLDRIYYTPTFFAILGLLALNLAVGNVGRFRTVYRTEKTLLKIRHLGSILFHLSLLLTMVSVILHFLYKYEGVFTLTEGQTVADESLHYFREFMGPLHEPSYGDFELTLDRVGHTEGEADRLGSMAYVTVRPSGQEPAEVEISANRPFRLDEYEFHFGSTTGYSPELILLDSADQPLFRTFMRVARLQEGHGERHFDFVDLPIADLRLEIEIEVDTTGGNPTGYQLDISRAGKNLYLSRLSPGDTAVFAGYKLLVPGVRKWCYIGAIKNPFLTLIFTGFWLCLAGLTLSLVGRVAKTKD